MHSGRGVSDSVYKIVKKASDVISTQILTVETEMGKGRKEERVCKILALI